MAIARSWFSQHIFEILMILIETWAIFMYGFFYTYPASVTVIPLYNTASQVTSISPTFAFIYPYYMDIQVMMFLGFGLLITYLRNNGWTSLGLNFFAAVVTIQLYILFRGFWIAAFTTVWDKVSLDFRYLLTADYCLAAVLLTWLACAGRISAFQIVFLAIFQSCLFALNEVILHYSLNTYDLGGTIGVFLFGSCFALAAGIILKAPKTDINPLNSVRNHHATLFAFLGTLFLWVFWPSFNAARVGLDLSYGLGYGNQSHRAVINTVLALTGSTIATFIFSPIFNNARFNVEHILKATLAGGVTIGAVADICVDPFAAILIGLWGGLMSLLFFQFVHPRMKHIDTLGVTSLFLWPSFWGAWISVIYVGALYEDKLGFDPSRFYYWNRETNEQAGIQVAALGISMGIGFVGGLISALLVSKCVCYGPEAETLYDDREIWVPQKDVYANMAVAAMVPNQPYQPQAYAQPGMMAQQPVGAPAPGMFGSGPAPMPVDPAYGMR